METVTLFLAKTTNLKLPKEHEVVSTFVPHPIAKVTQSDFHMTHNDAATRNKYFGYISKWLSKLL